MLVDVEADEQQFPAAEMERTMKAQEVILKAAAGKLKWWEAAEIIGVTHRTMRRWRDRLNEGGYRVYGITANDGRAQNAFRWRRWRRCCICSVSSILTSKSGTSTKSCGTSTGSGLATHG